MQKHVDGVVGKEVRAEADAAVGNAIALDILGESAVLVGGVVEPDGKGERGCWFRNEEEEEDNEGKF